MASKRVEAEENDMTDNEQVPGGIAREGWGGDLYIPTI